MNSVVMPVYLREPSHKSVIMDTINSLKDNTNDLHLIIVDDGSPLDTAFLEDYADHLIRHKENGGISKAWNTGKNNVEGEYVAIVNDDIKVPPMWYEAMISGFRDKKAGVAAPIEGGPWVKPYRNMGQTLVEEHRFYPGYCFMLKRDRFFEDFDEQFTTNAGDVDYWHRIREKGLKMMRVPIGIWHKEGGVLHNMDYVKISKESLKMFEDKWGFNPQEEYYK